MILRSLNKVVLHSISFSNYSGEAVRMRLKASKIDDQVTPLPVMRFSFPGGGEGGIPYRGLMGTCGQPGYVFPDFCLKQGIDFIIFCLNQGIDFYQLLS